MHYATTSAVVMAAICIGEVVAGPAHAHAHQRAHKGKRTDWAEVDWANVDYSGVDWAEAYAEGQASISSVAAALAAKVTAAPASSTTLVSTVVPTTTATPEVEVAAKVEAVASTTAKAAATTTKAASALESVVGSTTSDTADLFDGVEGVSNNLTAFGTATAAVGTTGALAAGDNYQGNVGSPYGSNIILASSTSGYDFTNTFTNTQTSYITVNVWQKVGPDMQSLSGSALAPKNTTLTFVLEAGASQIVAIQDNTQIAWAQACSATAASGAFATTWGEANFVSTGSGYDVSAIMNPDGSNYNMTITSEEATCVSSMTENYWLTASEPIGDSDGSCYVAQSTMHLTTKMGGTV